MSSWFHSKLRHQPTLRAEDEDLHLQHVENALLQLLNDNITAADKILEENDSSYHRLGRGISSFLASMLGGEKEMLKDASGKLLASESKNWEDMKKAQKEPTAYRSTIYPPGTEYLLCYAVSQLTSAICGVMSGSVTEAIKGFYKLKKAFLTLDGIMQIEAEYLKKRVGNASKISLRNDPSPATGNTGTAKISHERGPNDEKNDYAIHGKDIDDFEAIEHDDVEPAPLTPTNVQSRLLEIDPASVGITSHTDIFIHSGVRLCYGVLLVVFSMVENPLFNKILYIIGFQGDRARGTRYLWQATRFNNFNSAIAGFALLAYYNGLVGFCDILPTDAGAEEDLTGYPVQKCRNLLANMRNRYPESKLWRMEEARMNSHDRKLSTALKILEDNSDSKMKQIAAINVFEKSFTAMFLHEYELSAKCWTKCAELSQWSPSLYAYLAGVSYLEVYREVRISDPEKAKKQKELAETYIRKAPLLTGKSKVMSKELPFDTFITRKVAKWEERAKAWKVDLADASGVSPMTEMIYLWNGAPKQNPEELAKSLSCLQWEKSSHPEKFKDDLDEKATCTVLSSAFLRGLKRFEEARTLLNEGVIKHDRSNFKGHLFDDWTPPAAHYELACLDWVEKDLPGVTPEEHQKKVLSCEQSLLTCKNWGEYVLDGRLSMKVTTSRVTVARHKTILGI